MKKTTTKKLTLDREVLVPLQTDVLDHVGGGLNWAATAAAATRACGGTQFYCVPKTGTLTG